MLYKVTEVLNVSVNADFIVREVESVFQDADLQKVMVLVTDNANEYQERTALPPSCHLMAWNHLID